jgi:shikimate dehydrogenase
MKKYIVIGNPIEHSLSPKLHNYWFKKNEIKAIYEKKLLKETEIEKTILKIKSKELDGINVTVPFKNTVIKYMDDLTSEANETKSVNTIYLKNEKIIGHNTDIAGFELGLRSYGYDPKKKNIFIFGAGGVVPSIIVALKKMGASKILLYNRTVSKSENIKKLYSDIEIIDKQNIPGDTDMLINASSLGINKNDKIDLNYEKIGTDKFYYDVIYNPKETFFLKEAKKFGNRVENGKKMFIYQAHQAFSIWHKVLPKIDEEVERLLNEQ